MRIKIGDTIPIQLQMDDRNTQVYPQAVLYHADYTTWKTISLEHKANGLYAPAVGDEENMPDEDFVTAIFIVYSDAGHTTISPLYYSMSETYIGAVDIMEGINDIKGTGFEKDTDSLTNIKKVVGWLRSLL